MLEKINLPKLEQVGIEFLYANKKLKHLSMPKLRQVGASFLAYNEELTNLDLANLEIVGDSFLFYNKKLKNLNLPNLKSNYLECFLNNNISSNHDFLKYIENVDDDRCTLSVNGKRIISRFKKMEEFDLFDFIDNIDDNSNVQNKNENSFQFDFDEGILPEFMYEIDNVTDNDNLLEDIFEKFEIPNDINQTKESFDMSEENFLSEKEFPKNEVAEIIEDIINSRDVAMLDKKSELSKSEIDSAQQVIENVKGLSKDRDDFNK